MKDDDEFQVGRMINETIILLQCSSLVANKNACGSIYVDEPRDPAKSLLVGRSYFASLTFQQVLVLYGLSSKN